MQAMLASQLIEIVAGEQLLKQGYINVVKYVTNLIQGKR